MKIKVYSSLTLDKETVEKNLTGAVFAGPVKKDDILRDINERYNVILIIDGKFHQSLAVAVNEILNALKCGIAVYGASSMGALRASELYPYGMIGHGKIFEYLKTQRYFRDDYLGQIFVDNEKIQKISQPYIDLYFNLQKLVQEKKITASIANAISSIYRELHYTERNYVNLRAIIQESRKNNRKMLWAAHMAANTMGSQKRRDALSLLSLVKNDLNTIQRLNQDTNQ